MFLGGVDRIDMILQTCFQSKSGGTTSRIALEWRVVLIEVATVCLRKYLVKDGCFAEDQRHMCLIV